MTVEEVSGVLRVSQLTIYRYIKAKKLKAYKFGRDYRISKEDFGTFLDERKANIE